MKKSQLRKVIKESIKELMKEETYRITGKYNRDVNDNLRDVETDRPQDAWMFTEKYQTMPKDPNVLPGQLKFNFKRKGLTGRYNKKLKKQKLINEDNH